MVPYMSLSRTCACYAAAAGRLLVPNGSNLAVANEGVTTSWFSFFREPSFCSLPDAAASGARGIIQKTIAT